MASAASSSSGGSSSGGEAVCVLGEYAVCAEATL